MREEQKISNQEHRLQLQAQRESRAELYRELSQKFPPGSQVARADKPKDPLVILGYFTNKQNKEMVIMASPGNPPKSFNAGIGLLLNVQATESITDTKCSQLLLIQQARDKVVYATHLLRKERRSDSSKKQIPYLGDKPALRSKLFKEVVPKVINLLRQHEVITDHAPFVEAVRDFF